MAAASRAEEVESSDWGPGYPTCVSWHLEKSISRQQQPEYWGEERESEESISKSKGVKGMWLPLTASGLQQVSAHKPLGASHSRISPQGPRVLTPQALNPHVLPQCGWVLVHCPECGSKSGSSNQNILRKADQGLWARKKPQTEEVKNSVARGSK